MSDVATEVIGVLFECVANDFLTLSSQNNWVRPQSDINEDFVPDFASIELLYR